MDDFDFVFLRDDRVDLILFELFLRQISLISKHVVNLKLSILKVFTLRVAVEV